MVRTTNGDTDWFEIEREVRQGCVISPGLYNMYSEHTMLCVLEEHQQSEAEERPICGLQTTQPCCAQVRKSCWACSKRTKKPACPKTFCSSSFLSFHKESCPLNCALPMPGTADGDVVSRCQVLGRAGSVHHGAD